MSLTKTQFLLQVKVDPEFPELTKIYEAAIEKHNLEVDENPYPNSGFDLFFPANEQIEGENAVKFISMGLKARMIEVVQVKDDQGWLRSEVKRGLGFALYPRSSISKTPLMLANHVGIIDSSYRGNIIGAFRNLGRMPFLVEKNTRLLQICHPALEPFHVELVDDLDETSRGSGGFGSTGA